MISLRKRAEPVTLVRSPILTKGISGVSVNGFQPGQTQRLRRRSEFARGAYAVTASAMARICSGVVPQQPPTMLTKPLARELADHARPSISGVSS